MWVHLYRSKGSPKAPELRAAWQAAVGKGLLRFRDVVALAKHHRSNPERLCKPGRCWYGSSAWPRERRYPVGKHRAVTQACSCTRVHRGSRRLSDQREVGISKQQQYHLLQYSLTRLQAKLALCFNKTRSCKVNHYTTSHKAFIDHFPEKPSLESSSPPASLRVHAEAARDPESGSSLLSSPGQELGEPASPTLPRRDRWTLSYGRDGDRFTHVHHHTG